MRRMIRGFLNATLPVRERLGLTPAQSRLIRWLRRRITDIRRQREFRQVQQQYRNTQSGAVDVLLYCPVAPAGLTVQGAQLVDIFERHGISFQLTYHVAPKLPDHPLARHWVPREQTSPARMILFMERADPKLPYFHDAFKVMYVNLDWLKPLDFAWGRQYMDVVLHPVDYRLDFVRESFRNARVHLLKWPAMCAVEPLPEEPPASGNDDYIDVLYVGNDADAKSRKHPFELIEAILACRNPRVRFWLKFRSPLPVHLDLRLRHASNVAYLKAGFLSDEEMEALYRQVDVNVIPNASEGNGLSILEAAAKGVVPAVLDGYPMKTVVDDTSGFLIPCREIGPKRECVEYQTTSEELGTFFENLSDEEVRARGPGLRRLQEDLVERRDRMERTVLGLLHSQKLPAAAPPAGEQVKRSREALLKPVDLIDVYMTTCRRPDFLRETLPVLIDACAQSPYEHRITVMADHLDADTWDVLDAFKGRVNVVASSAKLGLPFMYNQLHDYHRNLCMRTERRPDYVCYIQDDCLIQDPASFFSTLVECREYFDAYEAVGYVSGYYTEVHPGFEKAALNSTTVVRSDSIDGKQFLAPRRLFERIGKLSWYFDDGMPRGNPGPVRGSHFDLWQWKEAPNATSKLGLTNLIIPGLCSHLAARETESTWFNATTAERVAERVAEGRVYDTRGARLQLKEEDFHVPREKAWLGKRLNK